MHEYFIKGLFTKKKKKMENNKRMTLEYWLNKLNYIHILNYFTASEKIQCTYVYTY